MDSAINYTTFPPVVTIDGPAASGKTTIGKLLADRLGYLLLDTGVMYRAATLAVLRHGVDPQDEAAVVEVAKSADIQIHPPAVDDGRQYTVLLDGDDVTWEIRSGRVDHNVSTIAAYAKVREEMVRQQREFGERGNVVMIGRDIGTVVLPEAPLKLYVTASAEERARRRVTDKARRGLRVSYDSVLADIKSRDKRDSEREHSPLRPAEDAVEIDTTAHDPQEILEQVFNSQ